jgi:hypothetical protein
MPDASWQFVEAACLPANGMGKQKMISWQSRDE